MAKATKVTIQFDDGTKHELDPSTTGSIFLSEEKAKSSGKKEPWRKPPQAGGADPSPTADTDTTATAGGVCYIVNGVVICP